jgi:hypothetical protein
MAFLAGASPASEGMGVRGLAPGTCRGSPPGHRSAERCGVRPGDCGVTVSVTVSHRDEPLRPGRAGRRVGPAPVLAGRAQWDEAPPCMRWRGLAQPHGTVPPISQRPLRRSTTYQGQERSQCSGRPDHRVAWGAPRAGGSGFPLCQQAGVSPKPGGAKYFPHRWLKAFFSPNDRGFPQVKRIKFSLRRVAKSFLLITRLGVSPPPHNLKFSLSPTAQSFLLRT